MDKYYYRYSHYSDEFEVYTLSEHNTRILIASFINRSDAEIFMNIKNGDWTAIAISTDKLEVSEILSKTNENGFEIKCGKNIGSEDFKR